MDDDMLSRKLDKLECDVAHLEDTLVTIYDEILRLRVDIAGAQSRFEDRWNIMGVGWKSP
jgi:uncharacterized coiled-coil protein SlyX